VQLRFEPKLTLEQYLSQRAWLSATLPSCPIDGNGCCPRRHGCYWRKWPEPIPIARFYCPRARTTFSLLPDFLSSRYSGELTEFEQVCVAAENDADCLSVANEIRPLECVESITIHAARRWVGRRRVLFAIMLRALLGVAVDLIHGVHTATELRERLGSNEAMVALRKIVALNLVTLPPPLGFGPWSNSEKRRSKRAPHAMDSEPEAPSG
jgi:hypothetical protein